MNLTLALFLCSQHTCFEYQPTLAQPPATWEQCEQDGRVLGRNFHRDHPEYPDINAVAFNCTLTQPKEIF